MNKYKCAEGAEEGGCRDTTVFRDTKKVQGQSWQIGRSPEEGRAVSHAAEAAQLSVFED